MFTVKPGTCPMTVGPSKIPAIISAITIGIFTNRNARPTDWLHTMMMISCSKNRLKSLFITSPPCTKLPPAIQGSHRACSGRPVTRPVTRPPEGFPFAKAQQARQYVNRACLGVPSKLDPSFSCGLRLAELQFYNLALTIPISFFKYSCAKLE